MLGVRIDSNPFEIINNFIIILDPPRDNGGADIEQYYLELEESKGKKETKPYKDNYFSILL